MRAYAPLKHAYRELKHAYPKELFATNARKTRLPGGIKRALRPAKCHPKKPVGSLGFFKCLFGTAKHICVPAYFAPRAYYFRRIFYEWSSSSSNKFLGFVLIYEPLLGGHRFDGVDRPPYLTVGTKTHQ